MELAKRKHPRLKTFDYSQDGCYFVTICTENKLPLLSRVNQSQSPIEDAIISLTAFGYIVENEILALPERYPYAVIDKYVIMPTHLHAIIRFERNMETSSIRPTLMDMICTFKSLTTRACNQSDRTARQKLWQTSFYEKTIRDDKSYSIIWDYIESNPHKWEKDEYYIPSP